MSAGQPLLQLARWGPLLAVLERQPLAADAEPLGAGSADTGLADIPRYRLHRSCHGSPSLWRLHGLHHAVRKLNVWNCYLALKAVTAHAAWQIKEGRTIYRKEKTDLSAADQSRGLPWPCTQGHGEPAKQPLSRDARDTLALLNQANATRSGQTKP